MEKYIAWSAVADTVVEIYKKIHKISFSFLAAVPTEICET